MGFINNDPEQIKIRKAQNTLIVVGTGIILFSVWTAVKMLGSLFMLRKETVSAIRMMNEEETAALSDKAVFYSTLAAVAIITLIVVALRAYVGLSAISEGRGKRRHRFYIPLAVIMIVSGTVSFFTNLMTFFSSAEQNGMGALSPDTSFSGLIIELTSMIMLTEMVASACRIRKLAKPGKKSGGR